VSPSPAGAAAAARHVEGNRHQIADLEKLDVTAFFDHLAGDLVAKHHASRRGGAAADHVLVGPTDVRRYDLEDHAVIDLLSRWIAKGRKVDLLDLDLAGLEVDKRHD